MVEAYLKLLDQGFYEMKFAFEGLADENVWKRPAAGLLSVGELAGHVAYWEAIRLAGSGGESDPEANGVAMKPDLARCAVSSPLIDERFGYYSTTMDKHPSEQQLQMTAEQVCSELMRIHEESVAHFRALNPDLSASAPGWPDGWTYGGFLEYLVFHVGYHTGQMYSVRHLLGDETPDN
ncbi:MAG: DinB family protein [Armatimonadetes bacterium]|nr:DinB family protein [Armatimonadota bacterium]MDE2205985.1 DinB family protein [Armatimonadota bacterium]